MKKINNACYAVLTILILFISSCMPDNSTTPTSTDARDQFVGSWKCTEKESQATNVFQIIITKSTSNTSAILINNINHLGLNDYFANATINNSSLTIANQQVTGKGGPYTVQGSGSMSNGTINLSYTVYDGVSTTNATAVCTK